MSKGRHARKEALHGSPQFKSRPWLSHAERMSLTRDMLDLPEKPGCQNKVRKTENAMPTVPKTQLEEDQISA
jgi:hypothetical protein